MWKVSDGLLVVNDMHTYYGASYVLQGVSFSVEAGETLAIVGRNGVGKTTTIRSVVGLQRPRRGSIRLAGEDISESRIEKRAKLGLALVPQGRHIFGSLSVKENLSVCAGRGEDAWSVEEVFGLFPPLETLYLRRGGALSGGEQSMLAIARALRAGPRCLLLDEPTEGLAPIFVEVVHRALKELRQRGNLGIVAVLPQVHSAVAVADRVAVMERGQIVYVGDVKEFKRRRDIHERYLGLRAGEVEEGV